MNTLPRSLPARSVSVLALSCLLSVVHAAQEIPGPLTVQVRSAVDAKPIEDVTVHVGGRMAVSDPAGKIVFDGIPAGTYDLWCRQPGHREFRETIELKNGERTPRVMSLVPETLSPLKFRFVEEVTGESVGCARIHMVPKAVSAALQGPMVFATDGGGNVVTIPVPEGVYHLTVEAPGFAGLDQHIPAILLARLKCADRHGVRGPVYPLRIVDDMAGSVRVLANRHGIVVSAWNGGPAEGGGEGVNYRPRFRAGAWRRGCWDGERWRLG